LHLYEKVLIGGITVRLKCDVHADNAV